MSTLSWLRPAIASRSAVVLFATALCVSAQQREVDAAKSVMTVHVSKSGILSALGHDHEISAPIGSGTVNTATRMVELRVRAAALRVRDPNSSDKDREEIQTTMLGPEVLDAERYPEISFRSTSAEKSAGKWTIQGELTLHGQSHPITVQVTEKDGRFGGSALLRQSDFGIKPIRIAGGTVRVKDEVRIDFDIQWSASTAVPGGGGGAGPQPLRLQAPMRATNEPSTRSESGVPLSRW